MTAAHYIVVPITIIGLALGSELRAARETEPRPQARNVAPAAARGGSSNGPPRVVDAFVKESYMQFNKPPFHVVFRVPTEASPFLGIDLWSPSVDGGFGGTCVVKSGAPIDLRGYHTMQVDLDVRNESHLLQVKLEKRDSGGPDGQFRAHDGALPARGRQMLTLPLAGGEATLGAVQRICFAMEATGFQAATLRSELKVYAVRFIR